MAATSPSRRWWMGGMLGRHQWWQCRCRIPSAAQWMSGRSTRAGPGLARVEGRWAGQRLDEGADYGGAGDSLAGHGFADRLSGARRRAGFRLARLDHHRHAGRGDKGDHTGDDGTTYPRPGWRRGNGVRGNPAVRLSPAPARLLGRRHRTSVGAPIRPRRLTAGIPARHPARVGRAGWVRQCPVRRGVAARFAGPRDGLRPRLGAGTAT